MLLVKKCSCSVCLCIFNLFLECEPKVTEVTSQVVGLDPSERDFASTWEELSTYEIPKDQIIVLFNYEDDTLEKVLQEGYLLSEPFK